MTDPSSRSARFGDLEPSAYPGERLGLPKEGSRSVGRLGRRVIAIGVDWGIAWLLSWGLAAPLANSQPWLVPAVFGILQILFIPTLGGSLGHRVTGMRVVPLTGGWVGLWRPVVRTLLLLLVIPALVWDSDQRGFHDKVAGTVLVRA